MTPTNHKKIDAFFTTENQPYYIYAPDYRQNSAGIRCLHYLCHTLNEMGLEAYIYPATIVSPYLHTARLSLEIIQRHFISGRQPIAVYPEIISGNPLHSHVVARWLLNKPGHLGGDIDYPENNLVFYFDPWTLPEGISGDMLRMPTVDTRIFNNLNNEFDKHRQGFCYYANKFLVFGGQIDEKFIQDGTSLCHDIPRSHEEIASILRKSETLYCYEQSAIVQEALACGCPVIIITNDYWENSKWKCRAFGARQDTDSDIIDQVKAEVSQYQQHIEDEQRSAWEQLNLFIHKTQATANSLQTQPAKLGPDFLTADIWRTNKIVRPSLLSMLNTLYSETFTDKHRPEQLFSTGQKQTSPESTAFPAAAKTWLNSRHLIQSDADFLDINYFEQNQRSPLFHIIVRLAESQSTAFADTLDSLINQAYENWHLDIISSLDTPLGIEDIPCIGWHVISDLGEAKLLADHLVFEKSADFVIELPSGAILDSLCIWRIAYEGNKNPEQSTFFVDDNCFAKNGFFEQLRLKPGVNPSALLSGDIAGPLFVRHRSWLATEGASQSAGSPWFAQLLRIADKFGWNSIKHIPDVLISYSGTFPTDTDACLLSLYKNLQSKGIQGDFVPATNQSWNIRYPLTTTPQITIAIISQNQLELLTRCFYSIVEKTSYPNYEILILVADESNDPDMLAWLENTQQQNTPKTRIIKGNQADNYAARCNHAVKSSANEFVALIKEDTVVIQAQWLEELVRTCLQEDVAAASPRLIAPGTSKIQNTGSVIGLGGLYGSPYQDLANLGDPGYLDCLQVARDVSILPAACMLVRTANYLAVSGMDDSSLGNYFAEADLCLKLRKQNQRLIYQPLSTLVDGGSRPLDITGDFAPHLHEELAKAKATETFTNRWLTNATVDPFWNPNLSLVDLEPTPEISFHPQWQYLPTDAPRILTRPLSGAQATYRITSPLHALRKAGMASECIWPMGGERDLTPAELVRLAPDSVIVQQYIYDHHLAALQAWQSLPNRPFTVYSLDDLITQMAGSNPFIKNFPSNSRTRLKYALDRCDRLVVPTNTLAEMSQSFISDIQVVPNRLEQDVWLPLHSKKRTGSKPRIGWAGGSSHQVDLILLKEVIEQTRDEADWIFFGMCPEEIRPLLSEFHGLQALSEYPKKLASLNLDIAVAPLAQIPFNQAKSNLRLLEYGALAIPVVCTDIDPYRGSPACCVSNTAEAWVAALRERIHAPDAREKEGIALRSWVHQNFLLENGLEVWLAAHIKAN